MAHGLRRAFRFQPEREVSVNLVNLFVAQSSAGAVAGAGAFFIVVWVVIALLSIFWLWMLIDALVNEPTVGEKILWFIVIFFLHIIGALIYYFVRRSGRTRVVA